MNAGEAPAFSRSAGRQKTGVFAAVKPCFPRKTSENEQKTEPGTLIRPARLARRRLVLIKVSSNAPKEKKRQDRILPLLKI